MTTIKITIGNGRIEYSTTDKNVTPQEAQIEHEIRQLLASHLSAGIVRFTLEDEKK